MRKQNPLIALALITLLCAIPLLAQAAADSIGKITSFTIVDADTDRDILTSVTQGTVDLSKTPRINIRANVAQAGSVAFKGRTIENLTPFAFAGDIKGNYRPWSPNVGTYTITATAYALSNGRGIPLSTATFTLVVSASNQPVATAAPTPRPTIFPSAKPTLIPRATPTKSPTVTPTQSPTVTPTKSPTVTPTQSPTATPTQSPTATPTQSPTVTPTQSPTVTPTQSPTATPTKSPTATPTKSPTTMSTNRPAVLPASYNTNCVACHGVDGKGGLGGSLLNYSDGHTITQMTTLIRNGKGVMPKFSEAVISNADIALIYAFFSSKPQPITTSTPAATPAVAPTPTKSPLNLPTNLQGVDPKDFAMIESCNVKVKAEQGIRRLTNIEITNSIDHLFGVNVADLLSELPADTVGAGFKNARRESKTPEIFIHKMSKIAEQFAARVSISATFTQRYLMPNCANSAACRNAFINNAGLNIFRRPLTADKQTRYQQLFIAAQSASNGSFDTAIKTVLAAMFQSPDFLYVLEPNKGVSGTTRSLDGYEMASRLSFFMWQGPPDAELLRLAATNELQTLQGIEGQVLRLMRDKKAHIAFIEFINEWFGLDGLKNAQRDSRLFPEFNPTLVSAMREEVLRNWFDLAFVTQGRMTDILNTNTSYLNSRLASLYGLPAAPSQFTKMDLNTPDRPGLLTMAGVLASISPGDHSAPVPRGLYFQTKLLCTDIPPPPPEAGDFDESITVPQNATPRERLELHQTKTSCAGCHSYIDPLGFGLEEYDALGKKRTLYPNGRRIDASGSFLTENGQVPFNTIDELSQTLAIEPAVSECFTKTVFQYATGQKAGSKNICETKRNNYFYALGDQTYLSLVLTTVLTESFRQIELVN